MALNSHRKSTNFVAHRCQWLRCICHNGVNDTAVQPNLSNIFANDLKHCCFLCWNLTRRHMTQWCDWHRCEMHRGVIETAVRCILHSSVNNTFVTCTAVSMTPLCKYDTAVDLFLLFDRLWLPWKGISIKKTYIGKLSYTISITFP
jgi:hypothetical protein